MTNKKTAYNPNNTNLELYIQEANARYVGEIMSPYTYSHWCEMEWGE